MKKTAATRSFRGAAALGLLLLSLTLVPEPARGAAPQAAAPAQAETVCIQCHGALPGNMGAPVAQWRKSIHAANGISCNGCHGGDPKNAAVAMSPMRGFLGVPKEQEIPAFCGRCHPGVLKDYLASAHGQALGSGGPTCVTCHGNHEVLKATLDIINEKSCSQCHSYERAKAIKEAMQQTEGFIVDIDRRITGYQALGVDTDRLGKTLFSVRNRFHTLFHDVDVERVKSESTQINAELKKLDQELGVIEDTRAKRRMAGGAVVFGMLLFAFLFHMMKKSYD